MFAYLNSFTLATSLARDCASSHDHVKRIRAHCKALTRQLLPAVQSSFTPPMLNLTPPNMIHP